MATAAPGTPSVLSFPSGRVLVGSCLDRLKDLPDASVDSIVTDPPYEIGFMGKGWDSTGIAYSVDLWRECLRVLKPGGHLLAFGATRSYHRMTVAIEDAGFEIRDSVHWMYGSGFPKSLDVSKAIDKRGGATAGFEEFRDAVKDAMKRNGAPRAVLTSALGNQMLSHYLTAGSQPAVPNARDYRVIRDTVGLGSDWDHLFMDEAGREVLGKSDELLGRKSGIANGTKGHTTVGGTRAEAYDITAPATDAAKQWAGWGTALKPAHEPVVVARKPLAGTVAANVLEHGTGAINIDGCRVGTTVETWPKTRSYPFGGGITYGSKDAPTESTQDAPDGRWPANIVFTHAADCDGVCVPGCPVAALDQQSGVSKSSKATGPKGRRPGSSNLGNTGGSKGDPHPNGETADQGGASRFFTVTEWSELDAPFRYVAKPGKKERNAGLDALPATRPVFGDDGGTYQGLSDSKHPQANTHPTVKPVALMRWLVRLVTPPGGTVLDPFLGSGTTAVAAILEGVNWVGCEMTADYLPIITGRVNHAQKQADGTDTPVRPSKPAKGATRTPPVPIHDDVQPPLFDDPAA
jgi:DNA modification methylase